MSNYTELDDKIAFHPGYYIKEIVEESGMEQKDFAKKLGISSESLNLLIQGKQNVSNDLAMKLSETTGTSAVLWLSLQKAYDALTEEISVCNIRGATKGRC